MKKRIFCALAIPLLFAVVSCTGEKEKEQVIQLSNTSEIQLTDKAVSIEREQFAPSDGAANIPMLVRGSDTLPSQINDLDGDGQWDALFVVTDFEPGETQKVTVHWVVGAWELSDPKFVEETYFVDYLTTLANQLVTKIDVQFENRPQ